MNVYKQFLRISLLIGAFLSQANGRTIAIAVDVSGSMHSYGEWQPQALTALKSVLSGEPTVQWQKDWDLSGLPSALQNYKLGSGDQVVLLKFGDVSAAAEYPFFKGAGQPTSIAGLESEFPMVPAMFREAKTNKPLAETVAARMAGKDGLVILISDFLVDAQMSDSQSQFVSDGQTGVSVLTHVILGWSRNRRVQIRFLQYSRTPETEASPVSRTQVHLGTLRLHTPKLISGSALQLAWNYEGEGTPRSYSVEVVDSRTQRRVLVRNNLLGSSILVPDPPTTILAWTVVATLNDDRTVQSRSTYSVPSGSSSWSLIFVLICILAGSGGAIYLMNKSDIFKKNRVAKKEKTADIL